MEEFKKNIKKVSKERTHKILNSYGVKDAFIYYKKHRPKEKEFVISDKDYRALIRKINFLLGEELFKSGELKLPLNVGALRIYRKEIRPVIEEGKLVYNAPINWDATLELWATDKESKVSKTLVKVEPGYIYSIRYRHHRYRFKNKEYYLFRPNRGLKLRLKEKIQNNKTIPYYGQFGKKLT